MITKVIIIIYLFIFNVLLNGTSAVGIDYFNAEQEETSVQSNRTKSPSSSKANNKSKDEYNHRKSFNQAFPNYIGSEVFSTTTRAFTTETVSKNMPTRTTLFETPLEILDNYDSNFYHLPKQSENFPEPTSFRKKILRSEETNTVFKPNISGLENKNYYQIMKNLANTSDDHISSLFNLIPAAAVHQFIQQPFEDPNNSIWYVMEKYPCWDLPALYGFYHLPREEDVFMIHRLTLRNVTLEDSTEEQLGPEPTAFYGRFNKWCAMPPCYGDHTLCLFPNTKNAAICGEKYEVKTPSIKDQHALLNTLNSMRNHVAKGSENEYPYLPSAANMKQVLYDKDLEEMAKRWLHQCLPGPAPCLSIDLQIVSQLECTKFPTKCCRDADPMSNCTPREECFVHPIIGCLYTWYWSAGNSLSLEDVKCGHIEVLSFYLIQILWANTNKIGCSYAESITGEIRVVCNFAPGAPFFLDTKYFCGFIAIKDITQLIGNNVNINEETMTNLLALDFEPVTPVVINISEANFNHSKYEPDPDDKTQTWGIPSLHRIYKEKWIRNKKKYLTNGTIAFLARLVTQYTFRDGTDARCDNNEPVYEQGEPGSHCEETSRRFYALCYEFRDPTPGYRLVAIIASMSLFTLILFDLFSSVMRQVQ